MLNSKKCFSKIMTISLLSLSCVIVGRLTEANSMSLIKGVRSFLSNMIIVGSRTINSLLKSPTNQTQPAISFSDKATQPAPHINKSLELNNNSLTHRGINTVLVDELGNEVWISEDNKVVYRFYKY